MTKLFLETLLKVSVVHVFCIRDVIRFDSGQWGLIRVKVFRKCGLHFSPLPESMGESDLRHLKKLSFPEDGTLPFPEKKVLKFKCLIF